MALIEEEDIATIRNETGIPTSEIDDDRVLELAADFERTINKLTSLVFEETEVTEKHDGNGLQHIFLDNSPIISVSKLKIGDTEISIYYIYNKSGYISLPNGSLFTEGLQNVSITYKYGFISTNNEFKIAKELNLLMLYKRMFEISGSTKSQGVTSEKFGDYSLTFEEMPYKGQISELKEAIKEKLRILGVLNFKVI